MFDIHNLCPLLFPGNEKSECDQIYFEFSLFATQPGVMPPTGGVSGALMVALCPVAMVSGLCQAACVVNGGTEMP